MMLHLIQLDLWPQIPQPNARLLLLMSLLAVLLTKVIVLRWKNRKVNDFMASIPGAPLSIPVLGDTFFLLGVTCKTVFPTIKRILAKRPVTSTIWVIDTPYLITSDLKTVQAILGSTKNIHKTSDYDFFHAHCTGIFTANGERWRQMRKMITPSFRSNVLATFGDNLNYHSQVFLSKLQNYASGPGNVDILVPVHLCTIDFICDNMMGCRLDVQKRNLTKLSTNLERSTEMIFERSFNVLLWSDLTYSILGKQKELNEAVQGMRTLAYEMLEQRMKRREERLKTASETDVHQIFVEILIDNIEGGNMTKAQAAEEIVEMFTAGSITTATTTAWVFKIMAMYPDIQEKVYREILDVYGQKEVTLDELSKLHYLEMVIKETLRHFSVPVMSRHIVEDVKVDENMVIPANVRVLMFAFNLHHNPEYWRKPGEFYPEHFSNLEEISRPKGAFMPFMSGPRSCPGNVYAMQTVKFLVANTLLHYEFSTDEKPPKDFINEDYRILFMLWPCSGFLVNVRKRTYDKRKTQSG